MIARNSASLHYKSPQPRFRRHVGSLIISMDRSCRRTLVLLYRYHDYDQLGSKATKERRSATATPQARHRSSTEVERLCAALSKLGISFGCDVNLDALAQSRRRHNLIPLLFPRLSHLLRVGSAPSHLPRHLCTQGHFRIVASIRK